MASSHRLAAIMFTDIVGYTALMSRDQDAALKLLSKNRAIHKSIIERYNGDWLKEMGDGTLASFNTSSEAVRCAGAIQNACEAEEHLSLRIGIHQGEVVFQGHDVFGDGVNIASRIEAIAPSGRIWVSESVHKNVLNKKGVETSFVREAQLKNVSETVRIYEVKVKTVEGLPTSAQSTKGESKTGNRKAVLIGVGAIVVILLALLFYQYQSSQLSALAQPIVGPKSEIIDKSIAVLPFRNDSPDKDNQYFCDGMMDEILNHLQKIAELGVKSRTAVEPYRNSTLSFTTIANELDVAFVLEGAVRKYGDSFRVTTQLIEVESGNHLWSDTYDGIFSDTIFVVQSNIAKKIASSMSVVISPEVEERIDKIPTPAIEAYDFYIRAKHEALLYWPTGDRKHLKAAQDLYDKSLQIDPEYLMAITGLGMTFMAEQNVDSALFYAERAIVLDPAFNRGYGLKGECYYFLQKSDLAIENYSKAINLPPKDDTWLWYHVALGRVYSDQKNDILKALPYLSKGLEMGSEHLYSVYAAIGRSYLNIGDYEKSGKYLRKSIELQSGCGAIWRYSIWMKVQGKFQQARQFTDSICQQIECERTCYAQLFEQSLLLNEFEKAKQYFYQWQNSEELHWILKRHTDYQIGYVYYQLGETEEAKRIFAEQIEKLQSALSDERALQQRDYLSLARIYAFTGDRDQALKYLAEYAIKGFRNGWHDFIKIDPFFASLMDDPKFKAIVKQAQEKKAALRAQVRAMEERGELDL